MAYGFNKSTRFQMLTACGFFMIFRYMCDRDDAARNDGVWWDLSSKHRQGGCTATNIANRTWFIVCVFTLAATQNTMKRTRPRCLGRTSEIRFSVTVGKPANHMRWVPSKVTFPLPVMPVMIAILMSASAPVGHEELSWYH